MNANHNQPAHTQPHVQQNEGLGPVSAVSVLLSVPEASNFLGIGIWSLRTLIRERRLPVVRVGRAFYLRRAALTRWAESEESFVRR
jgi:excisionase family DNA binding protein